MILRVLKMSIFCKTIFKNRCNNFLKTECLNFFIYILINEYVNNMYEK